MCACVSAQLPMCVYAPTLCCGAVASELLVRASLVRGQVPQAADAQPLAGEGSLGCHLACCMSPGPNPPNQEDDDPQLRRHHLLRVIVPCLVLPRHCLAACCRAVPCSLRLQAICSGALAACFYTPRRITVLRAAGCDGTDVCEAQLTAGCAPTPRWLRGTSVLHALYLRP